MSRKKRRNEQRGSEPQPGSEQATLANGCSQDSPTSDPTPSSMPSSSMPSSGDGAAASGQSDDKLGGDVVVLDTPRDTAGDSDDRFPEAVEMQAGEPSKPFPIVGVGASAGGLDAFTELLRALPADTGMALVLVQHMDPKHESILTVLLSKETAMPVAQVTEGTEVEPNHVYVIPPNTEMTIRQGVLRLATRPPGMAGHNPIDAFFTALALDQKNSSVGIILSGIGSDGTAGCKAIKAAGGLTYAQDEATAKFSGMPSSAVDAGCVDFRLPVRQIAEELARATKHPFLRDGDSVQEAVEAQSENGEFASILNSLFQFSGVDFSAYKPGTLRRRIARRMILDKTETLERYAHYLRENPKEVESLFEDILIHVTGFFREAESFEALSNLVFSTDRHEPIRVWVPGCSTGEEVYSIAIALLEHMSDQMNQSRIQIFGTDISQPNIDRARTGIYPDTVLAVIGQERLNRFFDKVDNGYQISKFVRDLCTFARHNLGKDPPFSRLDVVSCRNVLIYLGSALRNRAVSTFHYALKPGGYLLLGKSESIIASSGLFTLEDSLHKIYKRREGATQSFLDIVAANRGGLPRLQNRSTAIEYDPRKEAERIVLERYSPPSMVLSNQMQILNFQGDVGPYLSPRVGPPSFDLGKMLRTELAVEIRRLVAEVKKTGTASRRESTLWNADGKSRASALEVLPLRKDGGAFDFLVLFMEPHRDRAEQASPAPEGNTKSLPSDEVIARLGTELDSTHDYLRSVLEDAEASSEELRAANEEVLSSNEELHSTNEEMETAKEELQLANEELTTLNEELHNRNQELIRLANDLSSLLAGIEIPVIILGADRRIRRYTPPAEKVFNLIPSDVGRPLSNIKANLEIPDLEKLLEESLRGRGVIEQEVQDNEGRWFSLRMRPYNVQDGHADAIMLALVDIDSVKRSSDAIVETVRTPLVVLDSKLMVISANPAFYNGFDLKLASIERRSLFRMGKGEWNNPSLRRLLLEILPTRSVVMDFEISMEFRGQESRHLLINARQLFLRGEGKGLILLAIEDQTEKREAQDLLGRREAALRARTEQLRSLSGELIVRGERTARKIARDLHDEFAHGMLALSMKVANLANETTGTAETRKLRDLAVESRKLATGMQVFARGLHPAALEELGLVAAVKAECVACTKRYKIPFTFSERGMPAALPDELSAGLFRVAQEALRNVGQHSRAQGAKVSLESTRFNIKLRISDDGDGFDPEKARRLGGLGLISMEERVRLIGGKLNVISHPGDGTTLEAKVPLKSKSNPGTKPVVEVKIL